MVSEPLSEAVKSVAFEHFDDEGNHLGKCVLVTDLAAIVAAHTQALEAEVERLRGGIADLADTGERDGRGNSLALARRLRSLLDQAGGE